MLDMQLFTVVGKKLKHGVISNLFDTTEEIIFSLTGSPTKTHCPLPSCLFSSLLLNSELSSYLSSFNLYSLFYVQISLYWIYTETKSVLDANFSSSPKNRHCSHLFNNKLLLTQTRQFFIMLSHVTKSTCLDFLVARSSSLT